MSYYKPQKFIWPRWNSNTWQKEQKNLWCVADSQFIQYLKFRYLLPIKTLLIPFKKIRLSTDRLGFSLVSERLAVNGKIICLVSKTITSPPQVAYAHLILRFKINFRLADLTALHHQYDTHCPCLTIPPSCPISDNKIRNHLSASTRVNQEADAAKILWCALFEYRSIRRLRCIDLWRFSLAFQAKYRDRTSIRPQLFSCTHFQIRHSLTIAPSTLYTALRFKNDARDKA